MCSQSSQCNGSYRQQNQDHQDPSAHLEASVRTLVAPCVSTSFGKWVDRAGHFLYNSSISNNDSSNQAKGESVVLLDEKPSK